MAAIEMVSIARKIGHAAAGEHAGSGVIAAKQADADVAAAANDYKGGDADRDEAGRCGRDGCFAGVQLMAGARRKARELAMQMLYQSDLGKQTAAEVRRVFWQSRTDDEGSPDGRS